MVNFEYVTNFECFWKMGFRNNAIQAGSLDVGKKSKGKMKKDSDDEKEIGCCVKFNCFGKCIPSRSKVESSKSGTTSAYSGNFLSFLCSSISLVS